MSKYTDVNGLANFWNRESTRLEWAKWVYYHTEQTQELINRLISASSDELDLTEVKEDIANLRQTIENLQI